MPSTGPVLMTASASRKPPAVVQRATAIEAPTSSDTIDTVVLVGSPKVLNRSRRRTSAAMTPR